jgi:hypothetical protein
MPEGRTTVETTVDLGLLKFDSEWRIEPAAPARPRAGAADRGALPAVSVYYVGSLRELAELEPRLSYASFERELTVRRMEREVEELERLRKGDEERVRQERVRKDDQEWMRQERQRALDRLRTGAEAPASESAGAVTGSTQWRSTVVGPTGATAQPEPAPPGPAAPTPATSSTAADTAETPVAPAPVPAQRRARARSPSDEILRQISPY